MKRLFALAAVLLLTVSSFAQDGKSIYQKYSGEEFVSAVYISPAMFRLVGRIPDMEINGSNVNLGQVILSLKGLYILDSGNDGVNASLIRETDKLITKGQYELLMEAKDNGETIRMYTVGDDKTVTSFVMFSSRPGECAFICLDGMMQRDALEKIILSAGY